MLFLGKERGYETRKNTSSVCCERVMPVGDVFAFGLAFQTGFAQGAPTMLLGHLESVVPLQDTVFEFLVSLHPEDPYSGVLESFGQTEHNHAESFFCGRAEEGECELPKGENMKNESYNQQINAGLG